MVHKFYDLEVWKESHRLCLEIYRLTEAFPTREKYGIIDQLRRSSASISANIAEGFGRYHYKDKTKFYYQARGSLFETQNFILLSQELGTIERDVAQTIFNDYEVLSRRINALIQSTK